MACEFYQNKKRQILLFINLPVSMKFLINFLKGFALLLIALFIVYKLGPKPAAPNFAKPVFKNTLSLSELENKINNDENTVPHIKPECHARIVWNDTTHKVKTKYSVLYLHGFSASRYEGQPVDEDIAKSIHANIYEARLIEHGIDNGDTTMIHFTAENYYQSGEAAINIAEQLGDSVIVIGTSGGGSLALFLAARHPEIKSLIVYSPAVRIFRRDAALLAEPWGLQIARAVTGKNYNSWHFKNPEEAKYWVNPYDFQAAVQFGVFLKYAMTPETFEKIKCPTFVGYYYQDEQHQDNTVSVAAIKEMFQELGTPESLKRAVDFPKSNAHVLACELVSGDWQNVENETRKFLTETVNVK